MSDELLPCPFCGGEASIVQHEKGKWLVFCADVYGCGTEGWYEVTPTDAIAAWNRRTPTMPDSVRATMREALEFWRDMIHSSDEVNGFTTEGGRTTLVCIDAALAWIDAQEGTK